jgi:hypothetical protein
MSARFPALNGLGESKPVISLFEMMSILSVIHVRTPAKQFRHSEFSYWPISKRGRFIP